LRENQGPAQEVSGCPAGRKNYNNDCRGMPLKNFFKTCRLNVLFPVLDFFNLLCDSGNTALTVF